MVGLHIELAFVRLEIPRHNDTCYATGWHLQSLALPPRVISNMLVVSFFRSAKMTSIVRINVY